MPFQGQAAGAAATAAFAIMLVASGAGAAQTIRGAMETNLVPSPLNYTVLLPDGYETSGKTYPLFFWLHGGGGDEKFLTALAPIFQQAWSKGEAPEMVVVTPGAGRSFYMEYKDGSQRWETFITGQLLDFMRKNYRVSKEAKGTFIGGISMGGMGSLRIGLKHLGIFGAIMSMEPGIEPVFAFKDIKLEDRFYRSPKLYEEKYGSPVDEAYWAANNPATIVRDNADALRESGIAIYIEAGTEDLFGLDRGTDFLHAVLYKNKIRHEYRYVYGADHVGATLPARILDGLKFLNRIVNPPGPDPKVTALRKWIATQKKRAGLEP